MNWKNVGRLIRVDTKSGRLLRGRRLTRFRESRLYTYVLYGGALFIGIAVGALVGASYHTIAAMDTKLTQTELNFFFVLPTLVLIYSLVFTIFQQIQRSGAKFSTQAAYWLPITWEEHTLASMVANLFGLLLASIVFIGSAVITFSLFTGQVALAISAVLAMCVAALTASAITEIIRVLQTRFTGAVYKSTGRAAIWVRFATTLLFFLVFYVLYFYVVSGSGGTTIVQGVSFGQQVLWYVPFVWLGLTLYSFTKGLLLQGLAFLVLSFLFIYALYYIAVLLNGRFGLYEPPAITVSSGVYAPRKGVLSKLGFSPPEAALMRKDLKAFTRRRELMVIFIIPIIICIAPIIESHGVTGHSAVFTFALVFLFPASFMASMAGSFMIGEEGQAVWRVYSSPISAGSLVKAKYFFVVFFPILIMAITGAIGFIVFHPSLRAVFVGLFESLLLIFTLGAVSLSDGIRGADFNEVPRPRMVDQVWSLLNLIICLVVGLAILSPFFPYVLGVGRSIAGLYQAALLSAVVAMIFAAIFYRLALGNAKELLTKAEM
ncbi:MAG TPA: hypothetical protein VK487_05420 [Candidatus Bathyarchaeia archaeon]|nr:hypothetical protein [Candidatus Bathyarchaeia archaeon]